MNKKEIKNTSLIIVKPKNQHITASDLSDNKFDAQKSIENATRIFIEILEGFFDGVPSERNDKILLHLMDLYFPLFEIAKSLLVDKKDFIDLCENHILSYYRNHKPDREQKLINYRNDFIKETYYLQCMLLLSNIKKDEKVQNYLLNSSSITPEKKHYILSVRRYIRIVLMPILINGRINNRKTVLKQFLKHFIDNYNK